MRTDAQMREERRRDLALAWRYLLAILCIGALDRIGAWFGAEWLQWLASGASLAVFGILLHAVSAREDLPVPRAGVTLALILGITYGIVGVALAAVGALRAGPSSLGNALSNGTTQVMTTVLLSPVFMLMVWIARRWLRRPLFFASGYAACGIAMFAWFVQRTSHVRGIVEFDGHLPVVGAAVFIADGSAIHEYHTDSSGAFRAPIDRFHPDSSVVLICAADLKPLEVPPLFVASVGVNGFTMQRRGDSPPSAMPVVRWKGPLPPGC